MLPLFVVVTKIICMLMHYNAYHKIALTLELTLTICEYYMEKYYHW